MRAKCLAVISLVLCLALPAGLAQAADQAKVAVTLIDADGQPLAGVKVELVLYRFAQAIEEVPAGSCVTDAQGVCTITVTDPPRKKSGHIEGVLIAGDYGRQKIGWMGDRLEITLQLQADGRLATVPAPLGNEVQPETPTAENPATATRRPPATRTSTPEPMATMTATPAPTTSRTGQLPIAGIIIAGVSVVVGSGLVIITIGYVLVVRLRKPTATQVVKPVDPATEEDADDEDEDKADEDQA